MGFKDRFNFSSSSSSSAPKAQATKAQAAAEARTGAGPASAAPSTVPVAAGPVAPAVPATSPMAPGGHIVVLNRNVRLEGKLTFEGEARISGLFIGHIQSKGRLVLDGGSSVRADINVASCTVHGEVIGNLVAPKGVELRAGSRVRGDIETGTLVVERGATFDGACRMTGEGGPARK